MINLAEFQKVEIKIGKVVSAEKVEGADKLLRLMFDIGGEERQVLSGIALAYTDPQVLVGKEIPIITNLEPRTIRGFESRGMILAATDEHGLPSILQPDRDVPPGTVVK